MQSYTSIFFTSVGQLTDRLFSMLHNADVSFNSIQGFTMKKSILLSTLACGILLATTAIEAKTATKTLMEQQVNKHALEQKKAPKEITEGIQVTIKAVQLIETGKLEEAKKLLKKADDAFNKALKDNPALSLVPVEEHLLAYHFAGSPVAIRGILKLSAQLIEDHDTQAAITLLSPLKDELDISIISIPMKLYPASVKTALTALNEGNKKAALAALSVAFGTLVNDQITIPIPLLIAEDLVAEASRLDKQKKEDAKNLLEAAKEALVRAELLGYTKKHSSAYKSLSASIEKIEKEIKGKNEVVKLYEKLKAEFKKIIHDTRTEKTKLENPAEKRVQKYQKSEAKKAAIERKTFKEEAQKDKNKTIK